MNERIRALAEQCYEKHDVLGTYEFNKEKFAQLIVRDCALTAGLMEHEGRPGIGAQILDNFGVKS